jgi:glycine dehydrogenase subunit 2
MIRAFHEANGEGEQRRVVLCPDGAHGTNPATASMAGYDVVEIPTDPHGEVDLAAFVAALGPDTAAVMLTNPNTLGIFETRILEMAEAAHAVGAQLYYDGANLNAIVGRARPGRHGLRRRAPQPPQDLHHAARRRRARDRTGGRQGPPGAVPAGAGGRAATAIASGSRASGPPRSAASAASTATSATWCAPTPTSARSAPRACGA